MLISNAKTFITFISVLDVFYRRINISINIVYKLGIKLGIVWSIYGNIPNVSFFMHCYMGLMQTCLLSISDLISNKYFLENISL